MGNNSVADSNILVGGGTAPKGRACGISGAASQATDGATVAAASTRRSSKEECHRDTQTKTSKIERKGGVCFVHLFKPTRHLHSVVYQSAFLHSYTTKNRDIYQSFHRAEEQMKQVLKARKAEIKVSICCNSIVFVCEDYAKTGLNARKNTSTFNTSY